MMERVITSAIKLSHKQFRAMLKKFRRKKIRQKIAREREQVELLEQQKRESSPGYRERQQERLRNSKLYEEFEERERQRQHQLWLLRERQAQEEFKRKQEKMKLQKIKEEEEKRKMLEEFERQESENKLALEKLQKTKSKKEEALQEALSNLSETDGPWHNPIAPANYNVGEEREQCMFFSKTGCCRFGERCSRGHTRPTTSTTLLIKGMYSHFSIDQTARDDYDTDIALEYEDKECYQDFKNFYDDVLPEFKKFGKVVQFKVCNNFEPHLRGNVYVQFSREEEAVEAYKNFNGRYYAGKQITCEFTHVIRWRSAICGLHGRNLCPKGINCNFLHVFKNPHSEFRNADRDLAPREKYRDNDSVRKRDVNYESRDRGHRHESRSDRYDSRYYRYESRHDRYEPRSERYDSKNDRYESRNNRYESKSDRYESRSDRYESRSERYEYRSDRYESRSDRYDYKNDRYESKNNQYESRSERYDSRNNRYDSKDNYTSSSSSESSDDIDCRRSQEITNDRKYNSRHRKRLRDSSSESRSRSNSPFETSNKQKSKHKKEKRKKKSKKHKKQDSSSESSSDSSPD